MTESYESLRDRVRNVRKAVEGVALQGVEHDLHALANGVFTLHSFGRPQRRLAVRGNARKIPPHRGKPTIQPTAAAVRSNPGGRGASRHEIKRLQQGARTWKIIRQGRAQSTMR